MERKIKFRALADEMSPYWVYGNLIYDKNNNPRIQRGKELLFKTCLKGTECEYIGLKDKNKKDIYEGDINKCIVNGIETHSVVKMKNGRWVGENKGAAQDDNIFQINDIEVIGNIHTAKNL